jgi:hypothetical protein
MTRVLAAALLSIASLHPTTAVAEPRADAAAAIEPIMKQLEALRRDDYEAAYTFASASIQEMFDRPAFERMVRTGYPEIARSSSASVADVRMGPDEQVYVRVKIRGANGKQIEAVYELVWEGGRYRIKGVVTRIDPGLA